MGGRSIMYAIELKPKETSLITTIDRPQSFDQIRKRFAALGGYEPATAFNHPTPSL
jgi:hypothetical protein